MTYARRTYTGRSTTNLRRGLVLLVCALFLLSCGGGGGGGGSSSSGDPNSVGAGWVTITGSSTGNPTGLATVTLTGGAFISPTYSRCCSGSGTDTGVTVTWTNATTGMSGAAIQTPQYGWLFGSFLVGQTWQAAIDLAVGKNNIIVTAVDPSGNLGRATVSIARTPDVTPPTVIATNPANGATAVGVNSALTITFSEAMDPATISTATILLQDSTNSSLSGSVTYMDKVATFTPSDNLQGLASYTVTITTGVRDIAGNALATAYTSTFTTGPAPDTTPPVVSSTSPANGETCVPIELPQLTASFSEAVSPQTVNTSTFLLKDNLNNLIPGTASLDFSGLANFFPSSPLAGGSTYSGTLTTGLTDLAGNHLAGDYAWTFSTQANGVGTWNATSTLGASFGETAVWTGKEMIVWGGSSDAARYDPSADTWFPVSSSGAPEARSYSVAVWTGSKMIVWGGIHFTGDPFQPGTFLNTGGIYDPVSDTWASTSLSGAPSARMPGAAVWTGKEMIVWSGTGSGDTAVADGARYNPSTDSWVASSTAGAPSSQASYTAIWNGSGMMVWGSDGQNVSGGIYTPESDSWTAIPTAGAPSPRTSHVAVWTGSEMIVWGGWDSLNAVPLNSGGRFNPTSNTWQPTATNCTPAARFGHVGVWSGTELIVWGGASNGNGVYYRVGGRYDPNADAWQTTPIAGAPDGRSGATGIWTGTELIVRGGRTPLGTTANTGGRFRPQ